jgi:hypothetical protein
VSSSINGTRPDERRQTAALSVNGAGDIENNQMIDGADNNERLMGTAGVRVSIDAVAEVKIQTNLYARETGRTNGGVINVITKSGTNKLSGSAFDYVRRGRSIHAPTSRPSDPDRKQDQFGGSLGGPLKTNRTFFFADYEGYRLKEGQPNLITVPTPAMLRGDFSALLPNTIIYDPTTTPRTPFAGNIIPANRISPIARQLRRCTRHRRRRPRQQLFSQTQRTQDSDTVDIKIDHHFTQNDSAFVRYSYNGVTTFTPGRCPIVNGIDPSCVTAGVGGGGTFPGRTTRPCTACRAITSGCSTRRWSRSARRISQLRIGSFPPNEGTFRIRQARDHQRQHAGDKASGLAAITVTGTPSSAIRASCRSPTTTSPSRSAAWSRRPPGAQREGRQRVHRAQTPEARRRRITVGNYTFDAALTNSGAARLGRQCGGVDAPRLSDCRVTELRTGDSELPLARAERVRAGRLARRSWLTVNYGVRYDVYTPLTEPNDYISNFDLASAKILVANKDGVDRAVGVKTDWSNVAPRVGCRRRCPPHGAARRFRLDLLPDQHAFARLFRNPPFISAYGGPTINLGPSGGVPTLFLSTGSRRLRLSVQRIRQEPSPASIRISRRCGRGNSTRSSRRSWEQQRRISRLCRLAVRQSRRLAFWAPGANYNLAPWRGQRSDSAALLLPAAAGHEYHHA